MALTQSIDQQRILVTGGSGFLGGWIVRLLRARGETVRVLARRESPELLAAGAQVVLGDITDRAAVISACADCAVVYHTAAIAGIASRWEPFYATNTLGTYHVVDGCLRHGVKKLIYTSSPSVTFGGEPQCGIDESVPYPKCWLAHYPRSKALAETAVLSVHGEKLASCVLRPHLIWGPGDRHLIPRLIERARRGQLVRVGDGKNLIDTIYVENAAAAHIQAADVLSPTSSVGGRAYFLSQGTPVNCWDWIAELLTLFGYPPIRRRISYRAAAIIGRAMEAFYSVTFPASEPPMTRFLAAQLAMDHYFDISAAQRDFGYQPAISMAEGMQRLSGGTG